MSSENAEKVCLERPDVFLKTILPPYEYEADSMFLDVLIIRTLRIWELSNYGQPIIEEKCKQNDVLEIEL